MMIVIVIVWIKLQNHDKSNQIKCVSYDSWITPSQINYKRKWEMGVSSNV